MDEKISYFKVIEEEDKLLRERRKKIMGRSLPKPWRKTALALHFLAAEYGRLPLTSGF